MNRDSEVSANCPTPRTGKISIRAFIFAEIKPGRGVSTPADTLDEGLTNRLEL